jgi:hypothetical protein
MLRVLLIVTLTALALVTSASRADLRTPAWWDPNAVGTAPDWHYRVPVQIPSGAQHNTVRVDIDFGALLAAMGVSGTFDPNSPRVVSSAGTLVTQQEFTDAIYNNATDAIGNARGEVRFILQHAAPVTYYVYFDITENGVKPANTAQINGNFETGAPGTMNAVGWTVTRQHSAYDAQIRGSEMPTITDGTGGSPNTVVTDGTPHTGAQSFLIGARTNNEPNSGIDRVRMERTFTKSAQCTSGFSLRYRPEGWDSSWGGATRYDYVRITLRSGNRTVVLVGPDAPIINGNYQNLPYSPNFGSNQSGPATNDESGYGPYNGFDTNNRGGHKLGMTIPRGAQPWFTVTNDLNSFGNNANITLSITTSHTVSYRSWFHIDDVEWCVVNGTLGSPEAFGINVTAPTATTTYVAGQRLAIQARMDALPTADSLPVTASVYAQDGTLLASGIRLFNDGTHGDATANDAIWTNDGSVPADPTYTFAAGVPSGSNWRVVVHGRDASSSTIDATAGLIHRPGQPNTPESQANYFNVDEQTFTVQVPWLTQTVLSQVVSDPVNGTLNPKSIPGAVRAYTVRVTNQGPVTVDDNSIEIVSPIAANTCLYVLDTNGSGSGPVSFTDGTPSSGLSWTFSGLGSPTDSLDFSSDGGTLWSYTPTPNANGCDPAVTHIRLRPSGTMAGSSGAGDPWFELQFRVRLN